MFNQIKIIFLFLMQSNKSQPLLNFLKECAPKRGKQMCWKKYS